MTWNLDSAVWRRLYDDLRALKEQYRADFDEAMVEGFDDSARLLWGCMTEISRLIALLRR